MSAIKSNLSAFTLGVLTAFILLLINYTILGDVLIELSVLPLMMVTIGGFHFHHFILSFILLALGATLTLTRKHPWWGWFLTGVGVTLFIDDFKDLVAFLKPA